jgi:hypothetical protein
MWTLPFGNIGYSVYINLYNNTPKEYVSYVGSYVLGFFLKP